MKTWLKTELHTHTVEDPEDGRRIVYHSARELIDRAEAQGFEVLSITNHNQLLWTPSLQEYARKKGILLIPGVEATLNGRHFLLYDFLDYKSSWGSPEILARHKGPDQLVIAPHPFFPIPTSLGKLMFRWRDLIDAVEYHQFYLSWLNFNKKAEKTARQWNLPLVGCSDVHHLFQLGGTHSLIHAEKNIRSVLHAMKQNQIRIVSEPVSPFFLARWFGLDAVRRLRYAIERALPLVRRRVGKPRLHPKDEASPP